MQAQEPAVGITKMCEYSNSVCYRIACDCGSTDHSVDAWVEVRQDDPFVDVSFFVQATTPWYAKGFNRFKAAWDILWRGYREEEHVLILRSQQALNFAEAIKKSVEELEQKNSH